MKKPMNFTVRDALKIDTLQGAKVVGGKAGLDREVHFVNIMEVPDVGRWMKGGEFLLTAGFAFQEVPELMDTIIDDLDAVEVAAFGIKLGSYLSEIPAKLIEHANRLSLPLIELPPNIPYMDFMLPIFENLMMRQYSILKRVEQTHEQLIELALRGEGIKGICNALVNMLNMPVFILDNYGNSMKGSTLYPDISPNIALWEQEIIDFIQTEHLMNDVNKAMWNRVSYKEDDSLIIIPIEINGLIFSHLVVWDKEDILDEINQRALEHAATVIALETAKEHAVFESEQRIRGELLDELIWKRYKSEEAVAKRASFCNLNIREHLAIFVLEIDNYEEYILKKDLMEEVLEQSVKQDILQTTRFYLSNYLGRVPLVYQRSNSVVGIIPYTLDEVNAVKEVFQTIRNVIIEKIKGLDITIGIGRPSQGIRELDTSFEEAQQTIKVQHRVKGKPKVGFFRDQGAYCLLSELKDSLKLGVFYDESIGKLEEYDQRNNGELLQTLEEYYNCGHNIRETSEALYLHRNSIIYRLKKIEQITGKDLSSSEDNFELQLGLKILRLT